MTRYQGEGIPRSEEAAFVRREDLSLIRFFEKDPGRPVRFAGPANLHDRRDENG